MKHNNNNKPATNNKPKFVNKTLPLVASGMDNHGHEYDADSAIELITNLHDTGVFTKLSVMANVANALLVNKEDAKGTRSVARVQSFDAAEKTVNLTFFGKNVDTAEKLENMVVVPRVRTGRDSTKVETILFFELVNPMDA